jgi:hypothetical protein
MESSTGFATIFAGEEWQGISPTTLQEASSKSSKNGVIKNRGHLTWYKLSGC